MHKISSWERIWLAGACDSQGRQRWDIFFDRAKSTSSRQARDTGSRGSFDHVVWGSCRLVSDTASGSRL